MKALSFISGLVVTLVLSGCGGSSSGSGRKNTQVSGVVSDINGDPVRNARVWINGFGETHSNSSGAYVLTKIGEGDWVVRAEIEKDGIRFKGENVARTFSGERAKSTNITIVRSSQQVRIFGRVIDRDGRTVGGARVFAASDENDIASSTFAITDSEGRYNIDSLAGGHDYVITASARGFNNDTESINLPAGAEREYIFTLGNATDPLLPAPTNLTAVAWTSPSELTRAPQNREAVENIKRLYDNRRPAATTTRSTVNGNWIETDLFWNIYPGNAAHIGYGVYRRFGNSGQFTAIDFLRDPLANIYADNDDLLREFETWSYGLTALNTNYPDTNNGESNMSNVAVVQTLGDLNLNPISQGPLTFRWQTGSGAQNFVVYLFDRYPGIGVNSIWNNEGSPANGTSQVYNGAGLQSGRRYFFVVLGLANSNNSRTISPVVEFTAN